MYLGYNVLYLENKDIDNKIKRLQRINEQYRGT
jgi:uncharacterized protein YlbG (UPF0298 family)